MLDEQIKTIKEYYRKCFWGLGCFAFMLCLVAAACFRDLRALWLLLFFLTLFVVCALPVIEGIRICTRLKRSRGHEITKSEIVCEKIKTIEFNDGGKYVKGLRRIFGVRIYSSDGKKYVYVFTDSVTEITRPSDLEFSNQYSKKLNSRLCGKTLHAKLYGESDLVAEIKEFPLYEVKNWIRNGNTNGKFDQQY
ncbi:MAG: hypothetical protein IKT34_02190 [Clostridia bacterium]|nr:hypothetical protein [Clostridia bacterium]